MGLLSLRLGLGSCTATAGAKLRAYGGFPPGMGTLAMQVVLYRLATAPMANGTAEAPPFGGQV